MELIKFVGIETEVNKSKREFKKAVTRVLSSGLFILGKELKNFEKQFANYLEAKYCIGVGNGLEALQIALMSLGIGKNDEVITTPVSAVATTLAIMAVGAKPIFVDTTRDGLIDPNLIPLAITKMTKAILPVHLYGHSVEIKKIKDISKKFKLHLIEDASQAHGSTYLGKKLGTFGDLGCFSFYPTKNLGAYGDGGAIITNNSTLAKICYQIRDYGQEDKYKHKRFGINSRLDELQAVLLNIKLPLLDKNNQQRLKIAQRYIKNLSDPNIEIVKPGFFCDSNFHLFVIRIKKRSELIKFLAKYNIPTSIHYPLIIPDQPFLKSQGMGSNLPSSRQFVKEILSLPSHPYLSLKQVDFISSKILDFFEKNKKSTQNTKIKVFTILPKKLAEAAENFKREAYQVDKPPYIERQIIEKNEKFSSQQNRFKYLLAIQNNKIVGGLTMFGRKIDFQNKSVRLGGIGGCWTRKDKQREGIATILLKKAMRILVQNNYDIAYLKIDTKRLSKLYEQFGFQLLNRQHTFLGKSGKRYYERYGMIAPVTSKAIFTKVLQDKKPFDIGRGNW